MEPVITINSHRLSESEAMTVRVALESLLNDGLGEDEIGKAIARNYLENIRTIRKYIFGKEII
jgi:hypothetical protein